MKGWSRLSLNECYIVNGGERNNNLFIWIKGFLKIWQ